MPLYDTTEQTRQQLQLLRESLKRPYAQRERGLLREDITNVDNTARQQLQQALSEALGATLEVTTAQANGDIQEVQGIIRVGKDLKFGFTNRQPDGCYISCEQMELSAATAEIISKLQAYYATWYAEAAKTAAA